VRARETPRTRRPPKPSTSTDAEAAKAAGVPTIAYADKPGIQEHMPETHARAVIGSMADLALSLRASSQAPLEVPV
jgi:hypothetical protein